MTRKNLGGHDAYSKFRCADELEKYVKFKLNLADHQRVVPVDIDVDAATEMV